MREFKKPKSKSTNRFKFDEESAEEDNYDSHRPIFSFYNMHYGSKYCLSSCDIISKSSVADRLLRLSQLPWGVILSTSKESLGKENIPTRQFKVPLPPMVTPDVTSLMVFRFSDSERMAGLREKDVYHILLVGKDLYSH
jgi:hypothetical protein